MLDESFKEIYKLLESSTSKCTSNTLALSGGLDSAILAYFLKDKTPNAITVIAKDFLASDLTYSQIVSNSFGLKLNLSHVSTEDIMDGLEETIKILKNFNDIEIRNSVVIFLTLKQLKETGENSIINGDGADELFAGYQFLLSKSEDEVKNELDRILKIMHFPSQIIGKELGIKIESPFLSENIIEYSKSLPIKQKINSHDGKLYGKWILRKAFEEKIPKSIVWRQKSPMQDGSGTSGLTDFFETYIPDKFFEEKKNEFKQNDDVIIRSKESLHYYQLYRKYFKIQINENHEKKCKFCKYSVDLDSKFCRMCGAYPV